MDAYAYTAILAKTMVLKGKVTYTDKRAAGMKSSVMIDVPLDSIAVQGHVLGENVEDAKKNAIEQTKRQYPLEQGYAGHENVTVQRMEQELCKP